MSPRERLALARCRLNNFTKMLGGIVEWRDQLQHRLAYLQPENRFEFLRLTAEVRAFRKVCHQLESLCMQLHAYQQRVVDEVQHHKKPLIVAPTGSGKTVIASEIIRQAEYEQVLFLAHRREPLERNIMPIPPNAEVLAWDRHLRIKYAKSKQAEKNRMAAYA